MYYSCSDKIPGDLKDIDIKIKEIIDCLGIYIDDSDIIFNLRLVLSELFINGYEHGNKCDSGKCIFYNIKLSDTEIYIEVRDEGDEGIPCYNYDVRELKCCGRGLLIVKNLTNYFEIKHNSVICKIVL